MRLFRAFRTKSPAWIEGLFLAMSRKSPAWSFARGAGIGAALKRAIRSKHAKRMKRAKIAIRAQRSIWPIRPNSDFAVDGDFDLRGRKTQVQAAVRGEVYPCG